MLARRLSSSSYIATPPVAILLAKATIARREKAIKNTGWPPLPAAPANQKRSRPTSAERSTAHRPPAAPICVGGERNKSSEAVDGTTTVHQPCKATMEPTVKASRFSSPHQPIATDTEALRAEALKCDDKSAFQLLTSELAELRHQESSYAHIKMFLDAAAAAPDPELSSEILSVLRHWLSMTSQQPPNKVQRDARPSSPPSSDRAQATVDLERMTTPREKKVVPAVVVPPTAVGGARAQTSTAIGWAVKILNTPPLCQRIRIIRAVRRFAPQKDEPLAAVRKRVVQRWGDAGAPPVATGMSFADCKQLSADLENLGAKTALYFH